MPECIHGLEIPLCDICYPKAVPERPRTARVTTPRTSSVRSRSTSGATAGTSTPRVAGASTSRKSVNAAEQRVYHVTHIRNLEKIVADAALSASATPVVDVSSALTRELRLTATVPGVGSIPGSTVASVAEFVPFYFAPDAVLWEELRGGAVDETRWSDAARRATAYDFVFLVTTVGRLGDSVVIADGDAAGTYTRFASADGIQRMVERLHDDEESRRRAEALAPGSLPFGSVQLIGVANDRVRERVRELIGGTGSAPKVVVYPPWFQA